MQLWDFFQGTKERVRNSRGKRAISVQATEVLLYLKKKWGLQTVGNFTTYYIPQSSRPLHGALSVLLAILQKFEIAFKASPGAKILDLCLQYSPLTFLKRSCNAFEIAVKASADANYSDLCASRSRSYKPISMLNSTEHEIFPAHKC